MRCLNQFRMLSNLQVLNLKNNKLPILRTLYLKSNINVDMIKPLMDVI